MEIKMISDMAFQALISAYNALDLRKEAINSYSVSVCNSIIELCNYSIISFFCLFEWLVQDVSQDYLALLEKEGIVNEYNRDEFLFLLGKRPIYKKISFLKKIIRKIIKGNTYKQLQSITILNTKDTVKAIIKHISKKNFSSKRLSKEQALKEYYDAFNRFDYLSTVRNFITHGTPFRLSQQVLDVNGEVDDVRLSKYLEDYMGVTKVDVDMPGLHLKGNMVSEGACLNLAYEVSKCTINVMNKFYQACYGDKPYGNGWQLNGLDYVGLLFNSGIKPLEILHNLVKKDFPDSFKQTSPPSSSQ